MSVCRKEVVNDRAGIYVDELGVNCVVPLVDCPLIIVSEEACKSVYIDEEDLISNLLLFENIALLFEYALPVLIKELTGRGFFVDAREGSTFKVVVDISKLLFDSDIVFNDSDLNGLREDVELGVTVDNDLMVYREEVVNDRNGMSVNKVDAGNSGEPLVVSLLIVVSEEAGKSVVGIKREDLISNL